MRVIVEAPARLHLGFIDLNGQCGRLFGSIGVAVETPRCVVEARRAERAEAQGESSEEIRGILGRLHPNIPTGEAVAIRGIESIPRHVGFGSGTQLELSVAFAVSRLFGRADPVRTLALSLGRGRRSGIGVAVFERGGFVVDAGQPYGPRDGRRRESSPDGELPPVIFQHALPADWYFVIVTPRGARGLSGKPEERVFLDLPRMGDDKVGRICRLTLMRVAPGVATDDIQAFGEAITEIQLLVGEHFAPYQGGIYATATGRDVAEFALKQGAYGVGQSSWGPTVFALVRGEEHAADLERAVGAYLRGDRGAVFHTRASNAGAVWRIEP